MKKNKRAHRERERERVGKNNRDEKALERQNN